MEPVQGIVEGDATSGDWLVLVSRRPNGKISFVQGTAGGVTDGVCEDLTFQRLLVDLPESLLVWPGPDCSIRRAAWSPSA